MPRGFYKGHITKYEINLPEKLVDSSGRAVEGWEKVPREGNAIEWSAYRAVRVYLSRLIGAVEASRAVAILSCSKEGIESFAKRM